MTRPQNTLGTSCSVCGKEVPDESGLSFRKHYCPTCKASYCAEHREETTRLVAAGVDAEVTEYYCPRGHVIWDLH